MADLRKMTSDEMREYAAELVQSQARWVEYSTVSDAANQHLGREISDADAEAVTTLIRRAVITVEWPVEWPEVSRG